MLTKRDQFREVVFDRDKYKCVMCDNPAKDAHHIVERRLWSDGGYYEDNGVSLCEKHHLEAEMTIISCEELRQAAGIEKIILPEHLYSDHIYDKWGNIILANGNRLKGELFFDESVKKILKQGNVLSSFVDYVKYPRTYHLPWSPSVSKDDRVLESIEYFENKNVVVTAKMDGENTSMYTDYLHARSIDSESHPSQSWVRNFHSQIAYNIPEGWRICGENIYAKHAILYRNLISYFMGFSVWSQDNKCLDWNTTKEWLQLLGIEAVPVLYEGMWNEDRIRSMYEDCNGILNGNVLEGYVVRIADSFSYGNFRKSVAKYVRKNHVSETVHNWKHQRIIKNELSKSS